VGVVKKKDIIAMGIDELSTDVIWGNPFGGTEV